MGASHCTGGAYLEDWVVVRDGGLPLYWGCLTSVLNVCIVNISIRLIKICVENEITACIF